MFSASSWFSLFLPLHHTCPTFPSGWDTHCSQKTTCIPLRHIDSHTVLHWCPHFSTHCLQDSVSPPFEAYIPADLLDKYFLDTLPQHFPLIHLFSKTNLYHLSWHVVPLADFLLIYPVLDLLIFWSCGLMVFMKFGKNYLTNILKSIFSSIVFIPSSWKSKYMNVKLFALIQEIINLLQYFPLLFSSVWIISLSSSSPICSSIVY